MGTASASTSTVATSASTEGMSTAPEATSTATEGMSTAIEGMSAATEGTSTTIEGTCAATVGTCTAIESTSATTGVTVTEPTAKSSAPGEGPPASIVAPPAKAKSYKEAVSTPAPPRPNSNKDSARKPAGSIVAVGRACVGVIGVVTIGTRRRWARIHVALTPVGGSSVARLAVALIPVTLTRIRITLIPIALIRIRIARIPVAWIPVARIRRGSSLGMCERCNQQTYSQ